MLPTAQSSLDCPSSPPIQTGETSSATLVIDKDNIDKGYSRVNLTDDVTLASCSKSDSVYLSPFSRYSCGTIAIYFDASCHFLQ
jgi:hypothetical protein